MTRVFIPADSGALAVGAEDVARALVAEAARRGVRLETVRTGSRGAYFLEPLIEVETPRGRVGYGPIEASEAASLFDSGFLDGGAHPKALGLVEQIPFLARQTRLTFARCGVVDPLSPHDYASGGGMMGLKQAQSIGAQATIECIVASGLRGRGGAGFPTGIKWRAVAGAEAARKFIVCNADEGDSGTYADRILLEGDPFTLIEGMAIAAFAVGAEKGYVYIRSEYPHAFGTFQRALDAARREGWLGPNAFGDKGGFDIEARLGAGAYICGEETSLIESIEGKRAMVRAKPPIPAHRGLFGAPTVVNNVLSFAAAPWILTHGAKAYADFGSGRSRGTQPFQLAGDVKQGGLVELAFGVTIRALIEDFGAGTRSGRPIRAVQVGGPLGAYFPQALLDTPLDYEAMLAEKGMVGHGGVVVFNDTVDMAVQARFAFHFCAKESCGKCTPCRIGATRGQETIDRLIAGGDALAELALTRDLCETMTDASLCALGGLTPIPVMSCIEHFPEDFASRSARRAAE